MVENNTAEETPTNIPEVESPVNENESAESSQPQNEEIIEIIKRFAPDADTSNPQAILDASLQVLNSMVPIYDKVYDIALGSPEAAAFVNDLLETGDVAKSLARNYDPDELQALWEEVTDDSNEQDRSAYTEKVTKSKAKLAMIEANKEISFKNISDFMEQRKHWPPEKADEFEGKVIQFYQDGADGLITPDALELLEKGLMHDEDVKEAEENGTVIGKNQQIVAKKLSKEKEKELLPDLNGGAPAPVAADANEDPFIAGLKRRANQKPILS